MPKKSESVGAGKSDTAHSPMKDRSQKAGRGEASYDGEERRRKDRDMKPSIREKKPAGGMRSIGGSDSSPGGDGFVFNDLKKKSAGGKSKNGCFPKLLMLLLSIAACVVYFSIGL